MYVYSKWNKWSKKIHRKKVARVKKMLPLLEKTVRGIDKTSTRRKRVITIYEHTLHPFSLFLSACVEDADALRVDVKKRNISLSTLFCMYNASSQLAQSNMLAC